MDMCIHVYDYKPVCIDNIVFVHMCMHMCTFMHVYNCVLLCMIVV